MADPKEVVGGTYEAYQLADAFRDAQRLRAMRAPVGRVLPGAEMGLAAVDMYQNGANVENVGDMAANGVELASKRAVANGLIKQGALRFPVLAAGAVGWQTGRAIDENWERYAPQSHSEMTDVVGGTINQAVRSAGNLVGQDWGVDDSAYLEQKAAANYPQPQLIRPAAKPAPVNVQGGMPRRGNSAY